MPNYLRCIHQVRDYQNNPRAFACDVLRFEIALEGVKFLRALDYAPRDAALTTASVPSAIAHTPAAVNAVSTPSPLAAAAPAAPGAPAVATATAISGSISAATMPARAPMRTHDPATRWRRGAARHQLPRATRCHACHDMIRSQPSVLERVDLTSDASSRRTRAER